MEKEEYLTGPREIDYNKIIISQLSPMTQKVLKVGSSAAVTIPKRSLEELGIKIGDRVRVEVDRKTSTVTVRPLIEVDRELVEWTQQFIERYRPALERLAKK